MLHSIVSSPTINVYDVIFRWVHDHGGGCDTEERLPAQLRAETLAWLATFVRSQSTSEYTTATKCGSNNGLVLRW